MKDNPPNPNKQTLLELQRRLISVRAATLKAVRENNFIQQAKLDKETALINSQIREILEIPENHVSF